MRRAMLDQLRVQWMLAPDAVERGLLACVVVYWLRELVNVQPSTHEGGGGAR